jgi:hypothetical protein
MALAVKPPKPTPPNTTADEVLTQTINHRSDTPFGHCPTCGVLTQVREWSHKTGWDNLPTPITTVRGERHVCHHKGVASCLP